MARKAPLDPCIFCGELPCVCNKPTKVTKSVRPAKVAPVVDKPVAASDTLGRRIGRNAPARPVPLPPIAAPVSSVGQSPSATLENDSGQLAARPMDDTALEEVVLFLLKTKLGAKRIDIIEDQHKDPKFLVEAVNTRYAKAAWISSERRMV